MDAPRWFKQLKWSKPVHVAGLNQNRKQIPDFTGCYLFTIGPIAVIPGRVLYVGEAAGQPLRKRIATYLLDYTRPLPPTTKKRRMHKGQAFIFEARLHHGDHGVYLRWVEYGGSPEDIHTLEASLMSYLNPRANDRIEENRHPVLGDYERLDPRLIR